MKRDIDSRAVNYRQENTQSIKLVTWISLVHLLASNGLMLSSGQLLPFPR